MSTIMVILNIFFVAFVVFTVVGMCAWGIVTDTPFATFRADLAARRAQRLARAQRVPAYERRRFSREQVGYRGPGRRAVDVGA
jgi:hypothetical protein